MKFSRKVSNGQVNKCSNFGGDPRHRLVTGIVFQIRHYWEVRKVVNGHKSTAAFSHSFILIRQMAAVVIIKLYKIAKVDNFYVQTVAQN